MPQLFSKKMIILAVLTIMILLIMALLQKGGSGALPEVELSAGSGFYSEPFYLEMESSGGVIHYTLDGSRPDMDSPVYEKPVYITDRSPSENVYSMRTDTSVGFLFDEIGRREAGKREDYASPGEPVDKCTVVRAVCMDELGGRSAETSASYFVDYDDKEGYDGLCRISLYTDPENLFDYESGIYVTGKKTDDYLSSGRRVDNDEFWWWWPANYRMKGSDWERQAHVDMFDGSGDALLSCDVGLRIQGGGSRAYLPRSLNLFSTGGFDGDIFGDGMSRESLTLFAGGDSRITKLEDYLPASLCSELDISLMSFRPAVVFLEGEFWGFYFIADRYDTTYFSERYGVARDEVVMIKEGEISLGDERDLELYKKDMSFLRNVDVSGSRSLEAVEERIDLESYLDYYALQLYIDRRNDWPYMNYALWRTRSAGGEGYSDGRWRWILFDDNSGAYGISSISSNSIENTRSADAVFDNLMTSDEISARLRQKLQHLSETVFDPDRVDRFVDDYIDLVSPAMHLEFKRFYGEKRDYDHSFQVRCGRFKTFFRGRRDHIQSALAEQDD